MLAELSAPRSSHEIVRAAARWHDRLQLALACAALAGIALLCAIIASKPFFLAADSANDYAHVGYISQSLFHDARVPLHVSTLESGNALAFPYAVVPWLLAAGPYAIVGDGAVTLTMLAGFLLYGYAAARARPALRDPRLLALLYINTYLVESLVAFQMAFIWACALFFLFVEAMDKERWPRASALAVLTFMTHPFVAAVAPPCYFAYAAARRPANGLRLSAVAGAYVALCAPFALYVHSAPAVGSTSNADLLATVTWLLRERTTVVAAPFVLSALAPTFRAVFIVVFLAMALTFGHRILDKQVNTFGLDRYSRPFYGSFLTSPSFDRSLRYRVLEPNDREDGAVQLMRAGAVLTQEFFDQSQFRRWWSTEQQYACFLGAKHVDVVLLERDYPLKFNQNEDAMLAQLQRAGKARVIFSDHVPDGKAPRFQAYDVRAARTDGARLADCGL